MLLLELPPEILLEVATHLHSEDIATLLRTCRYLSRTLSTSLTDSIFRVHSPHLARRAFFAAARRLDRPRVKELLSRGILDIAEQPPDCDRIIYGAIDTESKSTVVLMLECGVRTDVLDKWRSTVIFHAVVTRRWDLLELLVEWPGVIAGIEKLGDWNGYGMLESLYTLLADGRDDLVWLIWDLIDDELLHEESFQLLLHLLLTNRFGLFTKLIETNRLDLQNSSRESRTILHEAVRMQALPFVEVILARQDVDVNFPDGGNRTPLHVAAAVSTDPAIIRLLLEDSRVDCSWVDSKGHTALHAAVTNGNLVSVETLLADPRCRFSQEHLLNEPGGWTA